MAVADHRGAEILRPHGHISVQVFLETIQLPATETREVLTERICIKILWQDTISQKGKLNGGTHAELLHVNEIRLAEYLLSAICLACR